MATQEEARQAILDAIAENAAKISPSQAHGGEQLKAMAEAWQIVKKPESSRVGRVGVG